MRTVLIAVLVTLALPGAAQAGRMPQPPGLIVHRYANPSCDIADCSNPWTREVWVHPGSGREMLSHEIGHVWFNAIPTDAQRAWFIQQLRMPLTPQGGRLVWGGWYRGTGWPAGLHSPDERAADAYMACDLGWSPKAREVRPGVWTATWASGYGYDPTARQHRRICDAIRTIGTPRRSWTSRLRNGEVAWRHVQSR